MNELNWTCKRRALFNLHMHTMVMFGLCWIAQELWLAIWLLNARSINTNGKNRYEEKSS